ncbi:glycohydrolase toxin TNT-related protein [Mycobacterium europaeum]|uniref:TNT domain-containing protein n=1 Tax=Mycobacterium europaeum TaxID=761804 RepID=UPI002ADF2C41|nr:glycohydrolase toxin TNT-related protein [Mycobacterium europaeum]MEA1161470.1 glycohydrolase toxin TNT-related protein [Mycobacterium europaeum]
MAPLSVDPEAMFAAGSAVQAAGEGLAANLAVLTAGFSANTGHDLPGEVFGLGYQDAAGSLLNAAAAAINACRHCGARIQQGAVNYSNVEAASTLGGGGGGLQAPAEPVKMTAPGPPGTLGPGPPPPALWEVVQSFVDGLWPDGDVAGIHAAAARWRGFGAAANGMRDALNASKTLFDGQHIPEAGKIDEALSQIGDCMGKLGEQCGELARRLDHFANEVDQAQDHIRDLLHRLESLANPIHTAMLIFEGDAFDEIKKIAQDVNAVLHQLGRDARALEDGIKIVMQVGDGLVVKSEKYVRGALVQFLGERVGNPVATVFDTWANTNEGLLKGAVGMVEGLADLSPQWFLVDPQGAAATWSGLGKTMWKGSLANSFLHPKEAAETNLQMLKSLLHVEDWRRDRPGLGLGENIFDVGTLLVPGAGEAGAAADGAGAAARGAEAAGRAGEGAAGGLRGIESARGALAGISKTGGDLGKNLEGVTGDLPKIEAPPAGGTPVGLSSGKPPEAPVEAAPHPPDAAPGAPQSPTPSEVREPGAGGGTHEPVAAPAGAGPHDPVGEPAAAPAHAGGVPDSVSEPAAAPAPASAHPVGGPHDPLSVPVESAPAPVAGGPHDPVSTPIESAPAHATGAGDPREAVSTQAEAPAPPAAPVGGGPHEPGTIPAGSPHDPVEVPSGGPHESAPAPVGDLREPIPPKAPGSASLAVPAPAGDRVPASVAQLAEHSPARAPLAASGPPVEAGPVGRSAPRPASVAPPAASAPHFTAPGGRPAEMPAPGRAWDSPGDGGPADGQPPHGGQPSGPGDRDPAGGKPDGQPPGGGGRRGHPHEGDGVGDQPPGGTDASGSTGTPIPEKIPGVDYSLPAADALRLLERPGAEIERLLSGGVPQNLLDGYEPLAGRSLQKFNEEFTIQGPNGEVWWDWEGQAPRNGFAGEPSTGNCIPTEIRLDRLGSNAGGFLSPEGVPLAERATPPGLATQYHLFEGTGREIPPGKDWLVQHGPAKEAFGQPGGGEQWIVLDTSTGKPVPVDELIQARLIREITPPT